MDAFVEKILKQNEAERKELKRLYKRFIPIFEVAELLKCKEIEIYGYYRWYREYASDDDIEKCPKPPDLWKVGSLWMMRRKDIIKFKDFVKFIYRKMELDDNFRRVMKWGKSRLIGNLKVYKFSKKKEGAIKRVLTRRKNDAERRKHSEI